MGGVVPAKRVAIAIHTSFHPIKCFRYNLNYFIFQYFNKWVHTMVDT